MISGLWDEKQGGLSPICMEIMKLTFYNTKVIDHISGCLDSFENIMPAAVVSQDVAQLSNDVSFIPDWQKGLSHVIDFRSARDAERLESLEQKDNTSSTPSPAHKERC